MNIRNYQKWILVALALATPAISFAQVPTSVTSLHTALVAFERSYPGMVLAIQAFCWVSASVMIVLGISSMKQAAESHASRSSELLRSAFWATFVGVCLASLPTLLSSLTQTLALTGTNVFDYGTNMQETDGTPALLPVIRFTNFIGLIAFVRSLFLLYRYGKYGNQDRTLTKALTLGLAGVLALNIVQVLKTVSNTFDLPLIMVLLTAAP